MSEEAKKPSENKRPKLGNKDFAKMRVNGKKPGGGSKSKSAYIPSFYQKQHGGEHPGAKPGFDKSRPRPAGKPFGKPFGDRTGSSDRKPGGFNKGPRRESPAREGSGTEGLHRPTGADKPKFVKREGSSARFSKPGFKKNFGAKTGTPPR